MNYFGAYHTAIRPQATGVCDAPHISKGGMTFSCFETASDAGHMVMIHGRMRNRAALAKLLCSPAYATQAQLLLKAYNTWGENCIRHIEGACMLAIADVEKRRMLLVRDKMGENAVFYAIRAGAMVFADHPDMILKSAFTEPVVNREGLCELFGLGPARSPGKTPLCGIRSLDPGCMLICSEDGFETRRYFELCAEGHDDSEAATIEHTRALLEASVEDIVPLHPGCMLSGGVDSTALTALLGTRIGRIESFSVDYRDNEKDFVSNAYRPEMDMPYINQAVRIFGTRHSVCTLEQDALAEALDRAVSARGFPGMADIDTSLLLFSREIVRRVPTVVSGECGDEVFGGYPWFSGEPELPEESFPWSGSMALRNEILRPEIREKLQIGTYVQETLVNALEKYDVSCVDGEAEKRLFKLQRLCFDFFMPNLQERAVKMCEFNGLQVLTPLCDDRLVRYVYNVPWRMKRMGGVEKGLYREAVRDLLPDKLRLRKKSPYPKTCSAAYASIIRGRMRALYSDKNAPIWQIVDADCIERLASSAMDPADAPWFGQLMAGPQMLAYLIQVNSWLRERNIAIELE